MKKSLLYPILIIIGVLIVLFEIFAIGFNNGDKNPNKNIHGIDYLNPIPYLEALIYPQEKSKIIFPRIVKNGCGKYAVQINMDISRIHSFSSKPIPDRADTAYYYIGIQPINDTPSFVMYNQLWNAGEAPPLKTPISFNPSYNIEDLKIRNKINVFSGDTAYNIEIGGELMFDKKQDAYDAMMNYTHKQILVQMFNDSIDNCHNYKP